MTTTAITLPPLSLAATVINNHHKQIIEHGKGMLREAKAAGEELLWVKKYLKHGEFKPWIAQNCAFPYRTASRYMQVAKSVVDDTFDPDATIDSVLDTNAHKRNGKAHLQPFSKTDAEYAQKLHTMSLRGTEHEREVAKGKLEAFAKSFGKTGKELMQEVAEVAPNDGLTDQEREVAALREELARRDRIAQDLHKRFSDASKDELIDLLADLKARGIWKD